MDSNFVATRIDRDAIPSIINEDLSEKNPEWMDSNLIRKQLRSLDFVNSLLERKFLFL